MSNHAIQSISGVLNNLSHASVKGRKRGVDDAKLVHTYTYDYLEIDGVRWGNMLAFGSLISAIESGVGKNVEIHYSETKEKDRVTRLIVGIQVEGEQLEPVLVEDVEQNYKGIKHSVSSATFCSGLAWIPVGGILSLLVGSESSETLGWILFISGLITIPYLASLLAGVGGLKKLRPALDFAQTHNRVR